MNVNLSNEQVNGLKAGIQDVMQGLVTLNKVLTMIQVPESARFPHMAEEQILHDSHVEAWKRHNGIHDAHVQAYERSQQSDKKRSEPRFSFQKGSDLRGLIT